MPLLKNKGAFFFIFLLIGGGILLCFYFWLKPKNFNEPHLSSVSSVSSTSDLRQPANLLGALAPYTLPAGSQMMIPPWMLQQYHLNPQSALYGDPLNFLIHHYGLASPSLNNKDEDTYYIPLTRYKLKTYDDYDDDDDDGYSKTIMMDVSNLNAVSDEKSPGGIAFSTKQDVNTKDLNRPAVPLIKPVLSPPSYDYQADCSDEEDQQTEAGYCDNCIAPKNDLQNFTKLVAQTVNTLSAGGSRNFNSVKKLFCNNCHGVDIEDFAQYAEQRAVSENVPPEILFGIMLRESNGNCNAKPTNGEKSFGLFQLNIVNSTKLRTCKKNEFQNMDNQKMQTVCKNGNYRTDSKYTSVKYRRCIKKNKTKCTKYDPHKPPLKQRFLGQKPNIGEGICLNNPYCNFEEALHLLKGEKWNIGNHRTMQKPEITSWVEMSREDRNKWRNAIIAYNGGGFLRTAKCNMKQSIGTSASLDDWEIKRLFFVRQYMGLNKNGHCKPGKMSKGRKDLLIHNLAYVERITGRETKGGLNGSSVCQWIKFRKDNNNLSCN